MRNQNITYLVRVIDTMNDDIIKERIVQYSSEEKMIIALTMWAELFYGYDENIEIQICIKTLGLNDFQMVGIIFFDYSFETYEPCTVFQYCNS